MNPWTLVTKQGEIITVKADNVPHVLAVLKRDGTLNRKDGMKLAARDVASFSEDKDTPQEIEQQAARAFNESIEVSLPPRKTAIQVPGKGFVDILYVEKAIKSKWVKKQVSKAEWANYYGKSPGYKLVQDRNGSVYVGFRLPVHLIDPSRVTECTAQEIARLDN